MRLKTNKRANVYFAHTQLIERLYAKKKKKEKEQKIIAVATITAKHPMASPNVISVWFM